MNKSYQTVDINSLPATSKELGNPLPVMEHFATLQGEGAWTGTASYFIRLAGCDVGCQWCDVKDSWQVHPDQYFSVEELVNKVKKTAVKHVVITGGEPTIYNLSLLTDTLHTHGLRVHIETAGVHPLLGDFDWICFSPKKFMAPLPPYYQQAHELKVVIFNSHDLKWAEEHAQKCADHVQLFLQPEWSKREKMLPLILNYIQQHPHWRLSQQTHKYIGIP